MARRRHHRRRNPTLEDVLPIVIGVVGGAAATYLYMNAVANSNPQLATSTSTTAPVAGTSTTG
jgi:hypothetical protein